LSLASRLIGVALTLSGAWLMGSAQGVVTVSNAAGNIVLNFARVSPSIGVIIGAYLQELVQQQLTPNYGSFWVFGVLLACGGLALIERGDKKPRPPEESLPLLTEPLDTGERRE
jgi:hypothetical protein